MTRYLLSIFQDGELADKRPIDVGANEPTDNALLRAVSEALLGFHRMLFEHVVEFRLTDAGGLTVGSLLLLATKSLPVV